MLVEQPLGFLHVDVLWDRDQVGSHHIRDLGIWVLDEPDVPVGYHSHDTPVPVDNWETGEAVLVLQRAQLSHGHLGIYSDRLQDKPGLEPLDLVNLHSLLLYRHVPVYHAYASALGHGYRHLGFCDCVHGSRYYRCVERYPGGQPCRQIYLSRKYR